MTDFAVAYAGRLQRGRAGSERHLTLAFIFEDHPALKDIDHLKVKVMDMPVTLGMFAGNSADHICRVGPIGCGVDAEIAILKKCSEPTGKPAIDCAGPVRMADGKGLTLPDFRRPLSSSRVENCCTSGFACHQGLKRLGDVFQRIALVDINLDMALSNHTKHVTRDFVQVFPGIDIVKERRALGVKRPVFGQICHCNIFDHAAGLTE